MRVIDLSHPISPGMPVYPGTEPPAFTAAATIKRHGFRERTLRLSSHAGTHLDAPAHIFPRGQTLDTVPIENFCGRAVVLDFTRAEVITPEHLEPYRRAISDSRFVILHTGWSRLWGREAYHGGFPVLSPDGARWVGDFDLYGLGVDAPSVDVPHSGGFPVHRILLAKGIIIVENLCNLSCLLGREFTFCCFPLKLQKAEGSPVRAVAIIDG
ncbi:MAG: cyclase family protein [Ammonifex sp.]|nr:MAG: cyclase family protein [Ammonifex sp.]